MRNIFGDNLTLTLFGESHGPYIGATLDGLPSGILVDDNFIKEQLIKRRPSGKISTARVEEDHYEIISGVFNSRTTGAPLTILIPNENTKSKDYQPNIIRPGHADYSANERYNGFQDYRGGGHFSGRAAVALVAVGAILIQMLKQKGIEIKTSTKSIYTYDKPDAEEKLEEIILPFANQGDSVGGIVETTITGLQAGIGEPWFDSIESVLSHLLFSVPAVKGVEFGEGFNITKLTGSQANDDFKYQDNKVITKTNNNGGINGGISNGMPIIVRTAIKPTPSIYKEQDTINIDKKENTKLIINGRYDPCIVPRAKVVIDSAIALGICNLLISRFGTKYFEE